MGRRGFSRLCLRGSFHTQAACVLSTPGGLRPLGRPAEPFPFRMRAGATALRRTPAPSAPPGAPARAPRGRQSASSVGGAGGRCSSTMRRLGARQRRSSSATPRPPASAACRPSRLGLSGDAPAPARRFQRMDGAVAVDAALRKRHQRHGLDIGAARRWRRSNAGAPATRQGRARVHSGAGLALSSATSRSPRSRLRVSAALRSQRTTGAASAVRARRPPGARSRLRARNRPGCPGAPRPRAGGR